MTSVKEFNIELHELYVHLEDHCVDVEEYGSKVALCPDKTDIFECPVMCDGTAERDPKDPTHFNWTLVTAPEAYFLELVNSKFGTAFRYEDFAGR